MAEGRKFKLHGAKYSCWIKDKKFIRHIITTRIYSTCTVVLGSVTVYTNLWMHNNSITG